MNAIIDNTQNIRVLNLSDIELQFGYLLDSGSLNPGSLNIGELVKKIRKYADMPYVYIVAKDRTGQANELLAALKAIRSPCYPYALFCLEYNNEDTNTEISESGPDIIKIDNPDPEIIRNRIITYASTRFSFDQNRLQITNSNLLPGKIDVVIVGSGITGVYAANRLKESGISFCILEKRDRIGGIWSMYANNSSQVNSSEVAYRLLEKQLRSNRDHSFTREILEDIAETAGNVSEHIFLQTGVEGIEKKGDLYEVRLNRNKNTSVIETKGVILAINDRVGVPREIERENQSVFKGKIVPGISDNTRGLDWKDKKVVIAGMGAFAVENARTALEAGASHVTVVCRRHGTICPKIIDYLNFATPYDDEFKHDKKSNMRNMMYWKKLYDLSGATQPECWMSRIKHPGHTISVSDIWFISHFLKKIETIKGEITGFTQKGVIVNNEKIIEADIIVNCIGFERNTSAAKELSGCHEMYNNNYIDKDFMYLADAYIDDDAFNSLFGSSVLEMVKFYMEIYIKFFNNSEYGNMQNIEGIEKISIEDRKWSHYIKGAMSLIREYPDISDVAKKQVTRRTKKFLEIHDLETYIAENKREWIDTHSLLAGKVMEEKDCLPYVFEKLLPGK